MVATYEDIARDFALPLERLARGYEADAEKQRDLLQEVHVGLWRSLETFDGRSSLRTWVYRVAHNIAVTHVIRQSRDRLRHCVPLEDAMQVAQAPTSEQQSDVARLETLVRRLRPLDRQVILLYLEGFEHGEIAEVCGLTRENAATKVHRIKQALTAALGRES